MNFLGKLLIYHSLDVVEHNFNLMIKLLETPFINKPSYLVIHSAVLNFKKYN